MAIALVLAGALFVATWTPPAHDIHTPGARAITNIGVASDRTVYVYARLTPTLSLDDMRCEAWRASRNTQCPDAATLEQKFWPGVAQSPKTLYIPLPPSCAGFSPGAFNLEYFESNRTLMVHCNIAAPWLNLAVHPPGVQALPPTVLIQVPTDAFRAGDLKVVEEDRLEHILGDDTTQTALGAVTIS